MSTLSDYLENREAFKVGLSYAPLQASWPLAQIISEICQRAGMPEYMVDLRGLEGSVDGFSLDNSHPAFTGIEQLARIFMFDASSFDGEMHFVPRGLDSVATLTRDDLIDGGREISKRERRDAISVPRVLHLEYYDVDGGLNPDKQTSDRSLDARSKSEVKMQTTVMMRPADAARAAVISHKVSIEEQRGSYEFSLPDQWVWLTTGDVITLDGERLRIDEIEIDDGVQHYVCHFDRASAYASSVAGVDPAHPGEPPTLIIGDTRLEFIDSHILRDADDRLGYYVAIAGATDNWSGAQVELSTDGGANYIDNYTGYADSVMGDLLTGLQTHARAYPDYTNTIQVELLRDDMELQSTDLAGMMSRVNMAIIGDELVNFESADEVSPGVWELSGFLRGRKGSPIDSHPSGTRFVLLNRQQLFFIDAELFQLGQDLTFRATSVGGTTQVVETVTFAGESQTERQPAYLTAERSGSDIVIDWQGVGRLGGGVNVGMGAYFEYFVVTVNGTAYTTPTEGLTVADPGGSVTITVAQYNDLTGAGPEASITI